MVVLSIARPTGVQLGASFSLSHRHEVKGSFERKLHLKFLPKSKLSLAENWIRQAQLHHHLQLHNQLTTTFSLSLGSKPLQYAVQHPHGLGTWPQFWQVQLLSPLSDLHWQHSQIIVVRSRGLFSVVLRSCSWKFLLRCWCLCQVVVYSRYELYPLMREVKETGQAGWPFLEAAGP